MSEYLFRCQKGHEFRAQFTDRVPVQCPRCYVLSPANFIGAVSPNNRVEPSPPEGPDTGGTGEGSRE